MVTLSPEVTLHPMVTLSPEVTLRPDMTLCGRKPVKNQTITLGWWDDKIQELTVTNLALDTVNVELKAMNLHCCPEDLFINLSSSSSLLWCPKLRWIELYLCYESTKNSLPGCMQLPRNSILQSVAEQANDTSEERNTIDWSEWSKATVLTRSSRNLKVVYLIRFSPVSSPASATIIESTGPLSRVCVGGWVGARVCVCVWRGGVWTMRVTDYVLKSVRLVQWLRPDLKNPWLWTLFFFKCTK